MTVAAPEILAELRSILTADDPPERRLEAMARAAVPKLAMWAVIDVRPAELQGVGIVVAALDDGRRAELETAARTLARGEHLLPELGPAMTGSVDAVRGGPSRRDGALVVALPLVSRGRLMGAMALGRERDFAGDDVELGKTMAAMAASAVDTARCARQAARERASRSDMLSVLAHDLRTPLSTLLMVTARLRKNELMMNVARSELDIMSRSMNRIESLLRNLVDCAGIEDDTLDLETKPVDLAALVNDATASARAHAGDRTLVLREIAGAPFEVMGDALRLRQVVDHVLLNAFKCAGAGGSIEVNVRRQDGAIVVSVSDDGFGIAAEDLERIFLPSWDLSADERRAAGPRFGLHVSRRLVEAHGGRMWAESERGRGATFTISMPEREPAGPPPSR